MRSAVANPRSGHRRGRKPALAALTTALVALLAVPLLAGPAAADPTATVVISQVTTPLAVSVDAGGTVTFINTIPARTDLLGVTLATDVTLAVPSGKHVIAPEGSWPEVFNSSCLTCTVTYNYRVTGGILPPLAGLPSLPASLPMVVNTVIPLPNLPLPPVNVPSLPAPVLPLPPVPSTVPTTPGVPTVGGTPTGMTTDTGATVGEQIMPSAGGPLILGAPNGFQERRQSGRYGTTSLSGGAGTGIGAYDGARTSIFGVPDGMDASADSPSSREVVPVSAAPAQQVPDVLGMSALLAVLLLSVVSASLVRTTMLSRRKKKVGAHSA